MHPSIIVAKDNLTSVGFRTIEDVDRIIFNELVIPQLLKATKDYGIKSTLRSTQLKPENLLVNNSIM